MKKFSWLLIFAVIVFGIFLRVYNITSNYYFSGELGKEMLYIRKFSLSHSLPLVGMQTSHEWLRYGPVYYWILIPVFNLLNGNPFILFWSAITVSVIGLLLNYFVIKEIINTKVAVISTLIQAISPLMIWQTRLSKLHVFFWILVPIFIYSLFMIWNNKKNWVFWAGLIFGLMFNFHFSQIPLVGVVVLMFWIRRRFYKIVDWIKFVMGVVISNITLIIYDAQNGFTMTKDLVLWIPYRILNFLGLYNKSNINDQVVGSTQNSFNEFLGRSLFWSDKLWFLGTVIFIAIFVHFVWTQRNKLTKDFVPFFVATSTLLVFLANIIHSAPPVHYFLPLFTIPSILFAIYLANNIKFAGLILIIIFIINFNLYFSFSKPDDFVAYSKQLTVAEGLISKADGREFSIKRIGPYDYFPENYSQNYQYLILWKGGKLTENSNLIYTIDETK